MATQNANAVSLDTPITIKVSVNDSLKKIKLPLRDLGANSLPDKVCTLNVGEVPKQGWYWPTLPALSARHDLEISVHTGTATLPQADTGD